MSNNLLWQSCNSDKSSDVVNDLRFEEKDKDKDLKSDDKDDTRTFPRGQQHWVTVKNGLLADIYQ